MLAVLIASDTELSDLKKRMTIESGDTAGSAAMFEGTVGQKRIVLVRTGIGIKRAAAAARTAVERYRPDTVLLIGAAGGIDPALSIGDVVVAGRIINVIGEEYICDSALCERVFSLLQRCGAPVSRGTCLTLKTFIHLAQEKTALFRKHAAAVIEMESAAAARVLSEYGCSFCNVRIVSDTARRDAVDAERLFQHKNRGGISLLKYLMRNPAEIVRGLLFRADLAQVSRRIADAVEIIAAGTEKT